MADLDPTRYGNVTARAWFSNVVLSLLLLGAQLFLCIYVLIVFFETPKSRRAGRTPYIALVFLIFILSAIPTCMDAALLFLSLLNSTSPADFMTQSSLRSQHEWMRSLGQGIPSNLLIFVGDGLLLFRCYIVCVEDRWLIVLPTLLYVATVVIGILSLVPSVPSTTAGNMTYGGICILISVLMNICITVTISARLVNVRRRFAQALPDGSKSVIARYTGVIAILIESALPLSVFGLIYSVIIATTKGSESDILRKEVAIFVFSILYFSFAALSPQLIIFRVTTGRSWTGELHKSLEGSTRDSLGGLSGGVVFARTVGEDESALELDGAMKYSVDIRRGADLEKAR